MIVLPPVPCVDCQAPINVSAENCYLCPHCGAKQPEPEKPLCDWCGKPACGAAGNKKFCGEHKTTAMQYFISVFFDRLQ